MDIITTVSKGERDEGLLGKYYNNTSMSGDPVLTRIDETINFEWSYNSPGLGVALDYFSVVWEGKVYAPFTGNYIFTTFNDDGVRLYVNNVLIINDWNHHPVTRNDSPAVSLTAGNWYTIKLEYFELHTIATIKLLWSYDKITDQIIPKTYLTIPDSAVIPIKTSKISLAGSYKVNTWNKNYINNGLNGEYFNNTDLSGNPVLERIDNQINFNWIESSPDALVNNDGFSVRWTGYIQPPVDEEYIFGISSDDGAKLILNGSTIIDNWTNYNEDDFMISVPVQLYKDTLYPITIEYFENTEKARISLLWSYKNIVNQVISTDHLYTSDTVSKIETVSHFTGINSFIRYSSNLEINKLYRFNYEIINNSECMGVRLIAGNTKGEWKTIGGTYSDTLLLSGNNEIAFEGYGEFTIQNFTIELYEISKDRIYLSDDTLFENKSWTISYSLRLDDWISFHSYIPDYYISTLKNYYSLIQNNYIYEHNDHSSYARFYEQNFPHIIELVSNKNPANSKVWDNIEIDLTTRIYDSDTDEFKNSSLEFFDKAIIYNSKQSTGEINIINNEFSSDYLMDQITDTQDSVIADKNENTWSLNNIRDNVAIYDQPLFTKAWNYIKASFPIDKVVNPTAYTEGTIIDFSKEWTDKQPLRDKYIIIRLINSNTNESIQFITNYSIEETTNSIR